jgi:hypothetical protein
MFEREMMIQGLRKQRTLLADLIVELEQKPRLDLEGFSLTQSRTKLISQNLRKLRRIKDQYVAYGRSEIQPQSPESQPWKELDHWLLWAGISQETGMPRSHTGIYTDFT